MCAGDGLHDGQSQSGSAAIRGIGGVAGLYPALRAAAVTPTEALDAL